MSEMHTSPRPFVPPPTHDSGLPPWRGLRLLIAPAYPGHLVVSVIVQPKKGHPHLHPFLRQLETPWFPLSHPDHLEAYAAKVALLRLAQTDS